MFVWIRDWKHFLLLVICLVELFPCLTCLILSVNILFCLWFVWEFGWHSGHSRFYRWRDRCRTMMHLGVSHLSWRGMQDCSVCLLFWIKKRCKPKELGMDIEPSLLVYNTSPWRSSGSLICTQYTLTYRNTEKSNKQILYALGLLVQQNQTKSSLLWVSQAVGHCCDDFSQFWHFIDQTKIIYQV